MSKHDLKVRPIYHWTPQRIRAHLAITFVTLLCVRHLQYRMSLQAKPVSPEVIGTDYSLLIRDPEDIDL